MPSQLDRLVRLRVPVGEVVNNRWVVRKIIGFGAHNNVYTVRDSTRSISRVVIRFPNNFDNVETAFLREGSFLEAISDIRRREKTAVYEFGIHCGDGTPVPYAVIPDDYKIGFGQNVVMPTHKILAITRKILQVLERIHHKGVVHGDVREENVLLGLTWNIPSAYLINFEDSEEFSRESQMTDIWYLMDMMVRMFRNGEKGVLPEGEMCFSHSDQVGDAQTREVLQNLRNAFEYRLSIRNPIPSEVSDLISELLSSSVSYERMTHLLKRAEEKAWAISG